MTISRLRAPTTAKLTVKVKQKPCKVCKTPFTKTSMGHVACSTPCAIEVARLKREKDARIAAKVERAITTKRLDSLKTRSDHVKAAQTTWNAYVRTRDHGKPCASCGVPPTRKAGGHNVDCSHYRSVGSAPHMRFHLHNAAAACVKCNRDLAGNVVELRKGLIARIGLAKIEAVEANNEVRKFSVDYLIRLKRVFSKKTLRLKKRIGL